MSSNSNQPIKILKRQPNANMTGDDANRTATKKPLRTLEEREAAYAEARRRILGSSPPPPSPVEETTAETSSKPTAVRTAPTPVVPNVTVPAMALPQQRLVAPPNLPYVGQNLIDFNRAVFMSQGVPRYPQFMNQHLSPQTFYYYYQ